jgi:hypothetical protein
MSGNGMPMSHKSPPFIMARLPISTSPPLHNDNAQTIVPSRSPGAQYGRCKPSGAMRA